MAKKATAKKVEEVKEVKAPVVEEKAVETAPVVADVASEKKPAKKAAAKKTTAVKAETKTAPKKDEVFVQFAGEEYSVEDVMDKAKAAYIAEGHRASAIKSVRLYIKPEERKAYYVINDKAAGSIEL